MGRMLVAGCILATYAIVRILLRRRRRASYPPGPPGLPFLGNLFQLQEDLWVPLTSWKEEYGRICYLDVAGQSVIVLNTHEAAADLLDRRAANYSDRPRNIVASDMLTGGLLVVFTRYSDIWRRMRRAAHEGLNNTMALRYRPVQTTEAVILTNDLIQSPQGWDKHLRRAAASMIVSVVYDLATLESEEDPSIRLINNFVERLVRAALPGAHFVEFFPWMRYLPVWLAKWKREALNWHMADSVMFEGLYDDVKRRVLEGDERPSFCSSLIENKEKYGLSHKESAWLAATMYAAGAETTSAVMAWFITAMAAYPEVQRQAQAEIDAIVGRSRMPTFNDYPNLPYIRALVKEALRWRPVDPIGLPHRSLEDDWYDGFLIPAGSICIANVWALNRDPDVYGEDAHHFNPARFLNENGELKHPIPDTKDEGHTTYGFGRRICVGRHVANNSLFINVANILWAVNISSIDGRRPDFESSINMGLVVRPVPSEYQFTPRFPEVSTIVAQTKELVFSSPAKMTMTDVRVATGVLRAFSAMYFFTAV